MDTIRYALWPKINKYDEHLEKCLRFLEYSAHKEWLYFSPDSGETFALREVYVDDPNCTNCGRIAWNPLSVFNTNERGCCPICNKFVRYDMYSNDFNVIDVHAERLRAERVVEEQDAVI